MSAAPKANGQIEFIVRIDGEAVALQISDLIGVRIGSSAGGTVSIMPGTVKRCLQLGADALAAEMLTEKINEIARGCATNEHGLFAGDGKSA